MIIIVFFGRKRNNQRKRKKPEKKGRKKPKEGKKERRKEGKKEKEKEGEVGIGFSFHFISFKCDLITNLI